NIVLGVASTGLSLFSLIIWLVTLVRGQTPQIFFSVAAAGIRYQARYSAYMSLVTDEYPRGLFGDADANWAPEWVSAEEGERRRELRLRFSEGARRLMVLILVLGVVAWIGGIVVQIELLPHTNPALVAAENKLIEESDIYETSLPGCR